MFATLRKLKIKTKVLVGFGIVLTLLVVVSVSSLVSFRITEWTLGNFLSQSDLNDMASSAQLDVQTLRRAASVYTYTANPEALKEARASLASLKTHIDDMIQTAPKPEYVTALNAALEDLAKYGEGIEKIPPARPCITAPRPSPRARWPTRIIRPALSAASCWNARCSAASMSAR
jgi:hypothetical protein